MIDYSPSQRTSLLIGLELISGGEDGSLRGWRDGKPIGETIATGQAAVRSLVELKNGELISGGDDGSLGFQEAP